MNARVEELYRYDEQVFDSIADLIPSPDNPTPMLRLGERFNPHADYEVLLKLEGMNPFGSIKDRTALYMLQGLHLKEGQSLVEPSAGNTGIALAALANARNTPIEIALPEGAPEEKKALLRFLGAEVLEVEDELCPIFPSEGARGVVKSMVESEAFDGKYVSPNQYESELNVAAHYHTTGPEIWRQTGGNIDYFFASIGTGGTITGVGRYLKEMNPAIKIIGVEPASRQHHLSGLKRITGLPDEYFPKILDRDLLDDLISVTDDDAFRAGIKVARTVGAMVGPTTGAVLHAAIEMGATNKGRAVLISADSATKYISAYAKYLED
ncbi:MAG: pyridoxal-phosphate dependent enzyme [Gammaproteobacteria bacterium]|nr:pyridoxal-phosphate dependent enzyme [Gammaproteobacteria bacterium]MBT8110435.1 pyridoxal-phosphate dependent enzyme [Gammaproteobacteria bacterium]NND46557.1 pyridoxal-phosphate dependent enzyme [Woeseiaceae bacterium]NNL45135.1 pyridoxal-phosphate dependent enzyme [Woeseiaceae bacterium]